MAGYDRAMTRFTPYPAPLPEDERNAVFLAHASVATDAILIKDRLNIPAEHNRLLLVLMQMSTEKWPRGQPGRRDQEEGSKF